MAHERFNYDWKRWIRTNVERGCSKDVIFRILSENGFSHELIKDEMGYEPSVRLERIKNPLRAADGRGVSLESAGVRGHEAGFGEVHLPDAHRIETGRAEIYLVEDFLEAEECRRLAGLIRSRLRPSTITNPDEPDKEFRTSRTCDLPTANPFVREVDEQICRYVRINSTCSEQIQGQHYEVGEQFKPHTDYFEACELNKYGGAQGQRTWTFMIYLNEPASGGSTFFPALGRSFKPRVGRALAWNNLYPDGRPNPDTQHYGTPVQSGTKTIITKWFRETSWLHPGRNWRAQEDSNL